MVGNQVKYSGGVTVGVEGEINHFIFNIFSHLTYGDIATRRARRPLHSGYYHPLSVRRRSAALEASRSQGFPLPPFRRLAKPLTPAPQSQSVNIKTYRILESRAEVAVEKGDAKYAGDFELRISKSVI